MPGPALPPNKTVCRTFSKTEPVAPHNVTFQVKDEELDQVFNW